MRSAFQVIPNKNWMFVCLLPHIFLYDLLNVLLVFLQTETLYLIAALLGRLLVQSWPWYLTQVSQTL